MNQQMATNATWQLYSLKVCPESRVNSQIPLKSGYIPCASKPSAKMQSVNTLSTPYIGVESRGPIA